MTAEQAAEQAAGLEYSCPFSRLRGPLVVQWRERQQLHETSQITVLPDYFVDDRDCSSFAQLCCLQNISIVSCYHLHA